MLRKIIGSILALVPLIIFFVLLTYFASLKVAIVTIGLFIVVIGSIAGATFLLWDE